MHILIGGQQYACLHTVSCLIGMIACSTCSYGSLTASSNYAPVLNALQGPLWYTTCLLLLSPSWYVVGGWRVHKLFRIKHFHHLLRVICLSLGIRAYGSRALDQIQISGMLRALGRPLFNRVGLNLMHNGTFKIITPLKKASVNYVG